MIERRQGGLLRQMADVQNHAQVGHHFQQLHALRGPWPRLIGRADITRPIPGRPDNPQAARMPLGQLLRMLDAFRPLHQQGQAQPTLVGLPINLVLLKGRG